MKCRRIVLSLIFACTFGGVGAHVWVVNRGVHFKNKPVDFGSPPPVYIWRFPDELEPGADSVWRPGTKEINPYDEEEQNSPATEIEALCKALAFEEQAKYSNALAVYRKLDRPESFDLGFIRKRIHILTDPALRSDRAWFVRLLKATRLSPPDPVPDPTSAPNSIRPYLAYERATLPEEYLQVAVQFPQSWIADSALIMAVRKALGSGDPSVEHISLARRAIAKLRREYPRSRFVHTASNWEGRIFLLKGQYANARKVYKSWVRREPRSDMAHTSLIYTEQSAGRDPETAIAWMRFFKSGPTHYRSFALARTRSFLRSLTRQDRERLVSLLPAEPDVAVTYFTIRLDTMDPEVPELKELLAQGKRISPRLPIKARGHVCSRLAEIAYHLNLNAEATRFATAVPERAGKDDLARAAFVKASVLGRRGKRTGALRKFRQLVSRYPTSYLVGGARENIALLSERQGDLASALDAYYLLKYEYDIAYIVDVRMTPAQLSSYILRRPKHKDRKRLQYVLGLRYLRLNQLDNASKTFSLLKKSDRHKMISPFKSAIYFDDVKSMQDPMLTIRSLRWLDNKIAEAKTAEDRARWMFSKADYFYTRRNLLFYNAALWEGERAYVFTFSWQEPMATASDKAALRTHHYDHEVLAHVSKICDAIIVKYPKSRFAPNAAFRSAVALNRLREMNSYWRQEDSRAKLSARVRNRKNWLIKNFPSHPLASRASEPIESPPAW